MSGSGPVPTDAAVPGSPAAGGRQLRVDARRNRDSLVTAARAAFAGAGATVALESVARDAGVGIGTLYRHFPTREALVEAVYAAELDDVTASAHVLLDRFPPDVALRAWMDRYAAFTATKRGMVDSLRAGWASGQIPTPPTRARITAAVAVLLTAGARAGALRGDVDPDDVTAVLLGVFLSTATNPTADQTGRLLDLTIDALRPRAPERPRPVVGVGPAAPSEPRPRRRRPPG